MTLRKSRRVGPVTQTDIDFADNIALLSNSADQAQELLLDVKEECRKVGLRLKAKKTEVMAFSIKEDVKIKRVPF